MDDYEPLSECWESYLHPQEKQPAILTVESSLQHPLFRSSNLIKDFVSIPLCKLHSGLFNVICLFITLSHVCVYMSLSPVCVHVCVRVRVCMHECTHTHTLVIHC